MIKQIFGAAAAALMVVGLLVGFTGSAHAVSAGRVILQPGTTYQYEYTISDPTGMRLDRNGGMQLRFTKDNIISGYYDPNDFLSFIPVTGGRDKNQFWLDIGSNTMHLLRVSGTIQPNGSLVGYAYRGASSHEFIFKANLKT